MRRRGFRGFTLVETMAVVAIAGVLTSLAVTGLTNTLAATAETRSARTVAQLMKRARSTAVARHRRVALRANATTHRLEIVSCPQRFGEAACVTGAPYVVEPGSVSFATDFHGVKVDVPAADVDGNVAVWNADGFPTAAAVFRFDQPATPGTQEVLVSVGGDVRTQSSTTAVTTHEL